MIFACMPAFGGDDREAVLLAHSIRRWGGPLAASDILICEPGGYPMRGSSRSALVKLGAEILSFQLPEAALRFPFAQKVYAAAAAEKQAAGNLRAGGDLLAWLDSDTLVLEPPLAFQLAQDKRAGCCPVQLKNISAPSGAPLNDYWQAVYSGCGASLEQAFAVTTTVDQTGIRAHFNAGLLVVRPQDGLLQAWQQNFERLYHSPALQPFYTSSPLSRIFAHQAVLSATLAARLAQTQFVLFSPNYNAAIFLRERFPIPTADLVTIRYDEYAFFDNPSWSSGAPETDAKIRGLLNQIRVLV